MTIKPNSASGVLVAKLVGRGKNGNTSGEKPAQDAIEKYMGVLIERTLAARGRVIKAAGDEMTSLFRTADDAASAAIEIQSAVSSLPIAGSHNVWAKVGVCFGAIEEREGNIVGEAATLALRLSQAASNAQILTTRETVRMMSPINRAMSRRKPPIRTNDADVPIEVYDLIWAPIIEGPGTTMR